MSKSPTHAPHVPRIVEQLPGHPGVSIRIYGLKEAKTRQEDREQAYVVYLGEVAVARSELTPDQRDAVRAFLVEHYPQHATI